MNLVAEQSGFTWATPLTTTEPDDNKAPVLKRSRLPWRKQWSLFDARPKAGDIRATLARPLSLFDGRELSGQELEYRSQADYVMAEFEADRPSTRGDCLPGGINEQRPCPWVRCRFHAYVDVNEDGALKLNFPGVPLDDPRIPYTCTLDAADEQKAKGPSAPPRDFVELGRLLNMTGTGSKKIIARAEQRMREEAEEHELEPSWDDGPQDYDAGMPAPAGNLRGFYDAAKAAAEPDPIHRQLQGGKKDRP